MMNNETARKNLQLVLQLRQASERHAQMSKELADQASEISKEVDAFLDDNRSATEPSGDERARPASLEVLERRETPSFDRLAAAFAEQHEGVEADRIHRRAPVADSGVAVIRTQRPVEKPALWARVATWWADRSPARRLPAGW